MKIQKTLNYLKIFPSITTFNLRKRFLSTLRMVLLVTYGFVITIFWLLRQSLHLASYLFVGLREVLISISTNYWKPIMRTTLLHQIQIQYTLLLTDWSIKCLEREQRLQKLSSSWTQLLKIKLNRLLRAVIRTWQNM